VALSLFLVQPIAGLFSQLLACSANCWILYLGNVSKACGFMRSNRGHENVSSFPVRECITHNLGHLQGINKGCHGEKP